MSKFEKAANYLNMYEEAMKQGKTDEAAQFRAMFINTLI